MWNKFKEKNDLVLPRPREIIASYLSYFQLPFELESPTGISGMYCQIQPEGEPDKVALRTEEVVNCNAQRVIYVVAMHKKYLHTDSNILQSDITVILIESNRNPWIKIKSS